MIGIDVQLQRELTPGCATGHHFNAAGAALPTSRTLETVIDYLRQEAATGGYEAAKAAVERSDETYAAIARLTGACTDEVAFVESATRAWQTLVASLRLERGDHVVVTRSEYVSNAMMLLGLERERGVVLHIIGTTAAGTIDLDELEAALASTPVAFVALGHIPTFSGLVEPVEAVGALANRFGVPFVLDATQSLGQLPLDVQSIGCDALVSTGRKFLRAPRGTGILVVRRPLLERLEPWAPDVRGAEWSSARLYELRDGARRFETWEHSPALRHGLGAAAAQALELGIDNIAGAIAAMAAELRTRLADLPGVQLADPPAAGSGIVTFTVEGVPAATVAERLARHRVRVVAVPASHGQWELGARGVPAVVSASVHYYNDLNDLDALGAALETLGVGTQV